MAGLPTTQYEQRDADPDGDIEFILNDPNGTPIILRVSGKVLSIHSPVFKALVRHPFQEGQALTASQLLGLASAQTNTNHATQPVKIALPEDDAQAMTWLCHALHLHHFLDLTPDLALVERIAVLSKKYQCAPRALRRRCLAKHTEKMSGFEDAGFQMLPEGFTASLKARRDRAISVIRETIEGAIDPLINPNLTEQEAEYKGRYCPLAAPSHKCQREAHIAHYMTELAEIGLYPLSRLNMFGMGQIHDALRQYRAFEETEAFAYRKKTPNCRCAFYSMDDVIKYNAVNTAAFLLGARFCLAPARAGRFDVADHSSCNLQGSRIRHNHDD
ncbi:MAG: hypothetical protein Q9212_007196 [Teloschistes hypoglaucus]